MCVFNKVFVKMSKGRRSGPRRGTANRGGGFNQSNIDGMTKRIRGPADPPQVSNDIFGEKLIQLQVSVPPTTGFNVTASTIAAGVSSGADMKFRIKNISVWGPAGTNSGGSGRLRVTMQDPNSDGAEFTDDGTVGAKRAQVHVRFGLLSAIAWRVGSNIDPIFHLDQDGITVGDISVVVHVSVQYRFAAPTSPTAVKR